MRILFLLAISVLLSSCRCSQDPVPPQVDAETTESNGALRPSFTMKEQVITHKGCDDELMECTQVQFSYPVFSDAHLQPINALVFSMLSSPEMKVQVRDGITEQALYDSAVAFVASYDEFVAEVETAQQWFWVGDAEFSQDFADFFTLKFTLELYSGGAHQITKEQFVNVTTTGRVIVAGDMFAEGSLPEVRSAIEKAFRTQNQLTAEQALTEAGLFKNELPFTNNVRISKEGLLFHYDPYEVAPWTTGPVDVMVSYTGLLSLMNQDWKDRLNKRAPLN